MGFQYYVNRFGMPQCGAQWSQWTYWSLWVLPRSLGSFWWVTCHDNTKLRKFSKIGLWSYFGAGFRYEGVVCQSGTKGRLTQWSEGSLEPPSLWVQPQYGRFAQNTVFCKLSIIVYFNEWNVFCFLRMGLFKYRYNLILVLCMKRIFCLRMGLLKHRYNLIIVVCMKRVLFFTNGLIET